MTSRWGGEPVAQVLLCPSGYCQLVIDFGCPELSWQGGGGGGGGGC